MITMNEKKLEVSRSLSAQDLSAQIQDIRIADFAEKAYLDYAVSVVKGRAIPDVADGLKPVQRRILFSMYQMSLQVHAKPVKSARVVGDVLGKFHPHGDQSAYDALVRLAQDFSLRYPLIEGQGNFGSRDGDSAAAMRYTEARLSKYSELLLSEIDEGTVQFSQNYDGTMFEPTRLPARLPICLLNGSSGIAVGMATEIPPHNITEVSTALLEILKEQNTPEKKILDIIQGPDFSGGGKIISSREEIRRVYVDGKGSLKTQGRWKIESLAGGQWQVVFFELPNGVSAQKVLEEIEELTNPKVKNNRKVLLPEQINSKHAVLGLLGSVRDESGKESSVRLVFEPKSSRVDESEFLNMILARTSLQSSVQLNLVAIDLDNRPKVFSLVEILNKWLKYRVNTVKLRSEFRLKKVNQRLHILFGRRKILKSISEVIEIIRRSDDPSFDLMGRFDLSEEQVVDILEIRLRQLARLELKKISEELKKLEVSQRNLKGILKSKKSLEKQVAEEIRLDIEKFSDSRRTLIEEAEQAVISSRVIKELATVVVSANGWVRVRNGHGYDKNKFSFKTSDYLFNTFECSTLDNLLGISTLGRVFSVPVSTLPGIKGNGLPFSSLTQMQGGEGLSCFIAGSLDLKILLVTKKGYGFKTTLSSILSRKKSGKLVIKLEKDDQPLVALPMHSGNEGVGFLSKGGYLHIIGGGEIKTLLSGGRGVRLVGLRDNDKLLASCIVGEKGISVRGLRKSGIRKTLDLSTKKLLRFIGKRGRKGKLISPDFTAENMEEKSAA